MEINKIKFMDNFKKVVFLGQLGQFYFGVFQIQFLRRHFLPQSPKSTKSLSLADRRDYEAKKKERQRLIKRHENMELFLKKQREEKQRQREVL